MNRLVNKAVTTAHQEGVFASVRGLIRHLLHVVYHERACLMSRKVFSGLASIVTDIPLECEILSSAGLEEFAKADFYKRPFPVLKVLCEDHRIVVARYQGKIVGGLHFETGTAHLFNWVIPLAKHEACVRMVFTVPEYQGHHIRVALSSYLDSHLASRDVHTVLSLVSWKNPAGLHSARGIGYEALGSIGHIVTFGTHIYYCTSLAALIKTKKPFHFRRSR